MTPVAASVTCRLYVLYRSAEFPTGKIFLDTRRGPRRTGDIICRAVVVALFPNGLWNRFDREESTRSLPSSNLRNGQSVRWSLLGTLTAWRFSSRSSSRQRQNRKRRQIFPDAGRSLLFSLVSALRTFFKQWQLLSEITRPVAKSFYELGNAANKNCLSALK